MHLACEQKSRYQLFGRLVAALQSGVYVHALKRVRLPHRGGGPGPFSFA
jgi:hypothetical protein